MAGAPDPEVLQAAVREGRILVTMDHDFGNVLAYRPEDTSGIVVVNPPGQSSLPLLTSLIVSVLDALARAKPEGRLWIVEPGRIREHEPENPVD